MTRKEWEGYCDRRNKYKKKEYYPEIRYGNKGWENTGRMIKLERKRLPINKRAA